MKIETGGSAFPTKAYDLEREQLVREEGMALRDYFAAKAMQTLAAYEEYPPERAAYRAYDYADAMLKAREE